MQDIPGNHQLHDHLQHAGGGLPDHPAPAGHPGREQRVRVSEGDLQPDGDGEQGRVPPQPPDQRQHRQEERQEGRAVQTDVLRAGEVRDRPQHQQFSTPPGAGVLDASEEQAHARQEGGRVRDERGHEGVGQVPEHVREGEVGVQHVRGGEQGGLRGGGRGQGRALWGSIRVRRSSE